MNSAFNGINFPGSASEMKQDAGKGMDIFHSRNYHNYSDILRRRIARVE